MSKGERATWIGELPRHWEQRRLKSLFQVVGGSTPKSQNGDYWDGSIVWVTPSDLSDISVAPLSTSLRTITEQGLASCGTRLVPAGSIILSTRAPIGSLGIAQVELCTNQGCKSLVPRTAGNSSYFAYVLSAATDELRVRGKGTTFLELSSDELGAFRVPTPPLPEQTAISAFLNRETGKIDALVKEQRRLIDLLKEKRQAVISHAVTKGLDPNASMKPSGVQWLGEVAEHWEVLPLKRCFASMDYGISSSLEPDGPVAVLRMGNIQDGKVVVDDLKYVDQVDADLLLRAGDLLYNRTNSLDLVGKVGCFMGSDAPTTFASYLVRLRTSKAHDPRFLSYLLNTNNILGTARSRAFVAIGQCNLNPTRYGEIVVACPDLAEQQSIAMVLDEQVGNIDQLVTDAGQAIGLLSERRAALISAAVTGKIDVREAATQQEDAA